MEMCLECRVFYKLAPFWLLNSKEIVKAPRFLDLIASDNFHATYFFLFFIFDDIKTGVTSINFN